MIRKNVISILLGIFLLSSLQLDAQKGELTLIDAFRGSTYPDRLSNTAWKPGSNTFTFAEGNDFMQLDAEGKNKAKVLFNLDDLNKALTEAGADSAKRLPDMSWVDKHSMYFSTAGKYFLYELKEGKIRKLFEIGEEGENPDLHKASKNLAFTIGNNLFVMETGELKQVSKEENSGIVYGQEVHRREFGISKGTFWSPNGSKLAFYRKDETMVTDYPLVNIETRISTVENTKYPMAGEASHHVTIGVYDMESEKITYLQTTGPKDQYLTNITWSPDGTTIYVAMLNRGQDHMKLNAYDAETGELKKTLFEEKDDRYVEPEHGPVFLPWDDEKFLWYSERDGWNHLYLYNTDGELIRQVTKGDFVVLDIKGFDKKKKNVYLITTEKSPVERHLYVQSVEKDKMSRITEKEGTHSILLSPSGEYFMDMHSSLEVGSEYTIRSKKNNKKLSTLVEANNPIEENFNLGEIEIFTIKAADEKTDLYCRMIKPHDFDENKKYPVLIYVYGGPHAQLVNNTWMGGANVFLAYMANQGYIVFTMDNRGSANRGAEFEKTVHRKLGQAEVADQMEGVKYLKSLPYVNDARIGVDGWSYGGFMTISLLLNYPDEFKAGVAGGPVIDWKYYEVMYGERYMDTPEENPEGYEAANLLKKVQNLDSRLMIIHGTMDNVVVWQHSLQFLNKAITNRELVDYFVYPGQEHNVSGIDRLHLFMKIEQYFNDHL